MREGIRAGLDALNDLCGTRFFVFFSRLASCLCPLPSEKLKVLFLLPPIGGYRNGAVYLTATPPFFHADDFDAANDYCRGGGPLAARSGAGDHQVDVCHKIHTASAMIPHRQSLLSFCPCLPISTPKLFFQICFNYILLYLFVNLSLLSTNTYK